MLPQDLLTLLPDSHRLDGLVLRMAVEQFDDPQHEATEIGPLYHDSLYAMWCAEERLPVDLRRLYYRELFGPASRFDANNGNCLDSAAYEWTLIHPRAKDRARAFVRTHILAKLCAIYDEGGEHAMLEHLREEFHIAAAEHGADREVGFDLETWEEGRFAELFAPLREGYKP